MLKRLVVFFFLSVLLCGCTNDNREVISFSSWGSVTEVEILNKVITNFETANPTIKVNFMHIPQNYFQKMHLLFASNTAPDVIFINNLYLPVYSNELEVLDNVVSKDDFFSQSINALSIDGKLLAAPRDISNFVFYYNKKFVKNAPSTFTEFDSKIRKFSSSKLYGTSYERDIFYAEPYILTLGQKEGTDYYLNLEGKYAPKPADVGSSTQAQMFLDEKIVFYLSGRWMYPKIKETAKFNFGVMTFPGEVYSDASGWAISKKTKHRDAAEKFVRYLASKENIDYFVSTGLIVPARKDSAALINNPAEKAFIDAIKKSKVRNPDRNYQKHRDVANRDLFK